MHEYRVQYGCDVARFVGHMERDGISYTNHMKYLFGYCARSGTGQIIMKCL